MPPASEPPLPVALPHTFRPFGVRMAVFVFGGLLVAVAAVVWFTFPPEIRDKVVSLANRIADRYRDAAPVDAGR